MKKAEVVERVHKELCGLLRPNAYQDRHPWWDDVKKGLSRMTTGELDKLWTLIICKSVEEGGE